ncbi:MAG: pyruvate carboxylase subunit B [Pseudomonadota bacterium]|nr:pyruvate carboxylase subunit B [Pseudomonadota bacterium]
MKKPNKVGITEVVLRDGSQSLLATRIKIEDMIPIASTLDKVGYWSIESWGGATYDACIRFLDEDPWERLRLFKEAMPNTKQQMLVRGQNLVGYKHYSDEVVSKFINKSSENGIDVFRVFDALNDFQNIEFTIKQVKENGKHAQGTMAYTTSPVHTLQTWLDFAKQVEDSGADSFAIKDMAGLLRPYDAYELVSALKEKISLPIHMQTHATTGMSTATNMKAIEAGIDNVDTSISSMSMTYGHTATESLVAIFENSQSKINLNMDLLGEVADYFKEIREKYSEFEGSMKGVDSSMLVKQVPGGMLSNLESQLKMQGHEDKLESIKSEIAKVRKDFGYPPLVTPASQIIGAQSMLNVVSGEDYSRLSNESIKLVQGKYGKLPGEISNVLINKVKDLSTEEETEENLSELSSQLTQLCKENKIEDVSANEEHLLTYALFPNIALRFFKNLLNK